jgi:leucyl-tRNA synthetase
MYIGGVEHAVLHLLYARFWHKVLYDCGLVHTKEPFKAMFNQGMILAHSYQDERGKYYLPTEVEQRGDTWFVKGSDKPVHTQIEKMSKSKKNVEDPLDIVARYGADALRTYEMFMGPLDQVKPWQTAGCEGVYRFLGRVWRLFVDQDTGALRPYGEARKPVTKALHIAIKEATDGIEALKFNTPVSRMMEFVNAAGGTPPTADEAKAFVLILSPYAPHLAEELWSRMNHTDSLSTAAWPEFDASALVDDTVEIAVQVMGKLRGTIEVATGATKDEVLTAAKTQPNVARHLEGKTILKEIFVPGRLVNFVAK